MGKLAERLSDPRRSGVYRIESLARSAPGAWQGFLAELAAAATARREAGVRFFAAFLDPKAALALAPLYNWQRSRSLPERP